VETDYRERGLAHSAPQVRFSKCNRILSLASFRRRAPVVRPQPCDQAKYCPHRAKLHRLIDSLPQSAHTVFLPAPFWRTRRIKRPRPSSPTNRPSLACTLPRTVTIDGRPSIAHPSKQL